jgi:hypothetical protein
MLFFMKKSIVWIKGFVISDENAKRKYFQWRIFVVQKNILFNQLLKIKFIFSFNTNTLFYFKENRIISLFPYSFKKRLFLLPNFSFQIFSQGCLMLFGKSLIFYPAQEKPY